MEGYLDKKARGKKVAMVRPWKRRYFILDTARQELRYYASADPAKRESDYKGKISVKGGSILESTSKKEFVFDFRCEDGEVMTLAASSLSERSKWVLGLVGAACAVTVTDTEYSADTPVGKAGSSSTPPSAHARQKSVTMEDKGNVSRGSVSLVFRKTGVQFMVERSVLEDKTLALSPKMKGFDYSRVVDLLKVNLSSRDGMGNINDSNVYSSAAFLVSLNLLVREEIFHQLGVQNVGPDDISPLLVNCFILAMVGLSRISLEIFELIDKYVADLSDVDAAIIDNHRALAVNAFDWCLANKYVDKPLTCDASVKIKIALYGFVATGKTSILFRYIDNKFTDKTMSTIGVDFRQKKLTLDVDGARVSCLVDVWDTAGQEKYRAMTSNFVKGADGVFIVYDASSDSGVDPEEQREGLAYLVPPSFPTLLFGNKVDMIEDEKLMMAMKVRKGTKKSSHFFGSALTGENVEEAFEYLVRRIAQQKLQEQRDAEPVEKTIQLKSQSFKQKSAQNIKDCC